MSCPHTYPANKKKGFGLQPKTYPSCSAQHLHDLLVKGLASRGHEVFYHLPKGIDENLPPGVNLLHEPIEDIDIYHSYTGVFPEVYAKMESANIPYLKTCHIDRTIVGGKRSEATDQWIYVSKTLADLYGSSRFIHCGLDPEEYIYSEKKKDYLLCISDMERYEKKGLDIAIDLAIKKDLKLVVAGTCKSWDMIKKVKALCSAKNISYVGDVRGEEKAKLYAGARAVLFPTRQAESFGLVIIEAMFSGTPVICSNMGACPEVMSPETGFICSNEEAYLHAIDHIDDISPAACRAKAMKDYHHDTMIDKYLIEYEKELQFVC